MKSQNPALMGISPDSINRIGVILRPNTPNLKSAFEALKNAAHTFGIALTLESKSAAMIGQGGECVVRFDEMCAWSDILVSIGGDGTLIALMRRSLDFQKPIFGINMGRLGFLTSIKIDELQSFLKSLKNGECAAFSHLILSGEILAKNPCKNPQKIRCVNEFLISKQNVSGMISIEAKINGAYFNTYRADGLIIGTPTGSSAYNISAGGPILYPYNKNVLLTPICAHSLTQKPLVLNDTFDLEFRVIEGSAQIIIDGQDILDFESGESLRVCVDSKSANLIYRANRDYFAVLREKFGWGEQHIRADF